MSKFYYCKRMRMLQFFKDKGFLPVETVPNIENPRFNVWVFEWNADFNNALTEYWADKINK